MIERLSLHRPVRQDFKTLTQPERGERALRDPIKKQQRLIALFIDDAHNLHSKTLIGLKRFATRLSDIDSGSERFVCALFGGRQLLDYRSLRELMC